MDTERWIRVARRKEIVELAYEKGTKTERPTSKVFAYGVKRLKQGLDSGPLKDVPKV